jgi:putative tricarboxylic transport membrane protein
LKINDALTGAALLLLGLVVLWQIQGYPAMPGQKYGAALFPGVIAVGLAICGVLLVVRGAKSGAAWIALDSWMARRRPMAGFIGVLLGLALYVMFADTLGFHLTGFLLLLAWMLVLGARPAVAVPVAILAPILIHLAFYKLLRIPLPWGVLQSFAF